MHVHRLDADATGAGETIDDQVHAAEQAAGQAVDVCFHAYRGVLVQPAARLDVDRLAGSEFLFEHVAVAVQPQDAVAGVAVEFVDEEARAAEQHVGHALHPLEAVVDGAGGGQELVFTYVQLAALLHVHRQNVARTVAAEGDHAVATGFGHKHLHAGHHAFQRAGHRLQADVHRGVLPQQDVMFEVDRRIQDIDGEHGHQLATDVIGDATEGFRLGAAGHQSGQLGHAISLWVGG